MRTCIAISSCIEYAPYTLGPLILSLRACGIEPQDIRVFGLDCKLEGFDELKPLMKLANEGIHSRYSHPFYFLMSDTCVVGYGFKAALLAMQGQAEKYGHDLIGLRPGIMVAHMGLVSADFIERKNSHNQLASYAGLSKRSKVEAENNGWLPKTASHYGHFVCREAWTGTSFIYGEDKPRLERRFHELDLRKFTKYRTMEEIPDKPSREI